MQAEFRYALEPGLSVDEFVDVLVRSTLAERRPVDDRARMRKMLEQADLIATARAGDRLVGVGRALSDFCYCTYLADLAVDRAYQGRGIGRELMRFVHAAAGHSTQLILLAAPAARSYYPHAGLTPHDSCWTIPRGEPLL
jgi:GNAT superfamily N-acetyltransferase